MVWIYLQYFHPQMLKQQWRSSPESSGCVIQVACSQSDFSRALKSFIGTKDATAERCAVQGRSGTRIDSHDPTSVN